MDLFFDLIANELNNTKNGKKCSLARRELLIINMLVEANGELVTREKLLKSCWEGKVVTDSSLNVAIRNIRLALIDCGSSITIFTSPRRGYSMIPYIPPKKEEPVREVGDSDGIKVGADTIRTEKRKMVIKGGGLLTMLIMFYYVAYFLIMPYNEDKIMGINVVSFGTSIDQSYNQVLDYLSKAGADSVYIMPDVVNCEHVQILASVNGRFVDMTNVFGMNSCESI
ncbi:winged helix-turn-helix domain-containing protein [Vibrio bathopelagicus]|uniref:winged helix-turn-helix domain-containing protein n=1 Tax=Vibrio bathopelagicus TaxID=2777577 RepID=UPI001863B36A|nr:winged helix-turn-helix domain-containing protein [Vibrio bathopelagicus]